MARKPQPVVISTDQPCFSPEPTPPTETPVPVPPVPSPPDEEGPVVEPSGPPATPPVVDPSDTTETTPRHVATAALKLKEFSERADDRASVAESMFALNYLDVFGYLAQELSGWKDISLGDVVNAVISFQEFFGLKVTGQLDAKTVRAMEGQRCGYPDKLRANTPSGVQYMRVQQFVQQNLTQWQKRSLKYAIESYVSGIGKVEQDMIFDEAFNAWEKTCGITVQRATAGVAPDIIIGTGRGQRSNFDGPGGTLAWAYIPQGDDSQLIMKFDMDETWLTSTNNGRGIFLFNVAAHEFGHLLGLDHSRVSSALMAPYYAPAISTPQSNDDIPRAQARYGPPKTPVPPVIPPEPPITPVPPPTGKRTIIEVIGEAIILVNGKAV